MFVKLPPGLMLKQVREPRWPWEQHELPVRDTGEKMESGEEWVKWSVPRMIKGGFMLGVGKEIGAQKWNEWLPQLLRGHGR